MALGVEYLCSVKLTKITRDKGFGESSWKIVANHLEGTIVESRRSID